MIRASSLIASASAFISRDMPSSFSGASSPRDFFTSSSTSFSSSNMSLISCASRSIVAKSLSCSSFSSRNSTLWPSIVECPSPCKNPSSSSIPLSLPPPPLSLSYFFLFFSFSRLRSSSNSESSSSRILWLFSTSLANSLCNRSLSSKSLFKSARVVSSSSSSSGEISPLANVSSS